MNNSVEVTHDNKTYVFVTRGRSKKFSSNEIAEYFQEGTIVKPLDVWHIPDNRQRCVMFMRDLQVGLQFCSEKYNVSQDDIIREAKRIAPHMNMSKK